MPRGEYDHHKQRGKKHSKQWKLNIGKGGKGIPKPSSRKGVPNHHKGTPRPTLIGRIPSNVKCWFVKELGHVVRSSLEEITCLFLKRNNIVYKYEPKYFKLKSDLVNGFKVDIYIVGTNIWIECKGPKKFKDELGNKGCFVGPEGKEKMFRFREQYSKNKLWIVTYGKMIDNFPKECYDKIFDVKQLDKLTNELLGI